MKTDRFSDIIRRKLESIRPEFSEKDWTRMQASLQTGVPQPSTSPTGNPFSGGMWAAKPWLMAAATISTVVLVAYSFWQHQEINHLRQTIGQLNKHPTQQTVADKPVVTTPKVDTPALTQSTEKQPKANETTIPLTSSDSQVARQNQRDTVYITRYVAVPTKSHAVPPDDEQRSADRLETTAEQRYATTNRISKSTAQPNQSDNSTNNPKTDAYGEPSTLSNTVSKNTTNSSVLTTKPTNQSIQERRSSSEYLNSRMAKVRGNKRLSPTGSVDSRSIDSQINSPGNDIARTTPNQTESTSNNTPAEPGESLTQANYELVNSLPLSTEAVNWNGMLAQRARRIRPARTTVVSGVEQAPEKAPESQPVIHTAVRLRVGVGGEVASKLLSAGVFTEVLLGKHWTVSAGLSQATYTSKFANDYDFDERMSRDFRKEFAHNIDPRREIFNIDTRTVRLQIPIAIGYRIPLTRSLTVTPNIGTNLNLKSMEGATFYCPVLIPQRGFDELSFSNTRSVDVVNSLTLGAGIEWQRGHWVLQGTPVLTTPIQNAQLQPDANWQRSTTLGLRARVLFQF